MAIIIDTEVNSLEHKEPIEVAFMHYGEKEVFQSRFMPEHPIEPAAAVVHGMLLEDLLDCRPSSEAFDFVSAADYWIGHNIDFDWEVLGSPDGVRRICTLAISRALWPELGSHKQTSLVYSLRGMTSASRDLISGAHRADADILILAEIILPAIKELNPELKTIHELWEYSEECRIPKLMTFGKHKGELVSEIPASYRSWLLRQEDLDPYLAKALTA